MCFEAAYFHARFDHDLEAALTCFQATTGHQSDETLALRAEAAIRLLQGHTHEGIRLIQAAIKALTL